MKRILIVDDEIGARTLIGIMLDRGGFEVLKASDATEALGMLDEILSQKFVGCWI